MNIGRRGFITGLISLAAAPAIVRASSLMPVKVMEPVDPLALVQQHLDAAYARLRDDLNRELYGDHVARFWYSSNQEPVLFTRLIRNSEFYK